MKWTKSKERLETCHADLQELIHELAKTEDFFVLCGTRSKAEQDAAVACGASKATYPTSNHNHLPSLAVDIAPYPLDWGNTDNFNHLLDKLQQIADNKGIKIKLGRDFKSLVDLPHVELK
jgi:hypothetical protein